MSHSGSISRCLRRTLAVAFLIAAASPARAIAPVASPVGSLEGIVISVSDGDHLTFSNSGMEVHVSLYGIEAPVVTKARRNEPWIARPGQRFAGRSFMALAKKVLHRQVRLDIVQFDHHDSRQLVGIVNVDGRNINLEMVAEGYAWAGLNVRKPDSDFMLAEEQARAKKLGLWMQDNPQPPWDFRKNRKTSNRDSW